MTSESRIYDGDNLRAAFVGTKQGQQDQRFPTVGDRAGDCQRALGPPDPPEVSTDSVGSSFSYAKSVQQSVWPSFQELFGSVQVVVGDLVVAAAHVQR